MSWFRRIFGGDEKKDTEAKPPEPPRDDLAKEIAKLCGGAAALLERAEALSDRGDHRLASSLADYALEASPANGVY